MKISTNLFFDRASSQITAGQKQLAEVQVQLASGKKINNASEAPEQASTLQRLRTLIQQQESFQRNIDLVNERLQTQDASLSGVNDLMQRLRELSIQYTNGTLGADQRRIAAIEVRGIREQVLSLANTVDSTGKALFAGSRVQAPAFSAAGVYLGDQTPSGAPVGSSRLAQSHRAGGDVFVNVIRKTPGQPDKSIGFFKVIDDLASALETNDLNAARRGIDEVNLIHQGVSLAQADIGANLNLADSQSNVLREQLLQLKSLQSDMQDVDYAESVSKMQKQMLALEAAQTSFAKISGLSLFQFI